MESFKGDWAIPSKKIDGFKAKEKNSHFWTSLEMILKWLEQQEDIIDKDYLRMGIENSLKENYNLQKTFYEID